MSLTVTFTEKDITSDLIGSLFKTSALMSDHVTRMRQSYINKDVDLGSVKGRVVSVDYKTITIREHNGEKRTVPITSKLAASLSSTPQKKVSRKSPTHAQTGTTTRK